MTPSGARPGGRAELIDRHATEPLWAQVLVDLRTRLELGEFAERFPTDHELMDTYGVSRHTVRDAVRRLHDEGVLERARGRGTFVRRSAIEQPLGALYSLFASAEAQGFEQRSEVLSLELRAGTASSREAGEVLGVDPDEQLVFLERVRFIDDEAFAVDCSWLPATFAEPLLEVDFSHTALYRELAKLCDVTPTHGWERIEPQLPTPRQRELLGVGDDIAVFAIERLASDGERAIEWRHSVVRGDRYSFVARWSGAQVDTTLEPSTVGSPESREHR